MLVLQRPSSKAYQKVSNKMTERGKHIWVEGTDGTGKSTQVELLQARLLEEHGIESIAFHEPGGEEISQAIRGVILDGTLPREPLTNVLLFSASRSENWHKKGKSALAMGKWVFNARSFWSTEAFQGNAEGVDVDLIREITRLSTDDQYMHPDHAVVLDLNDDEERARRIAARGELHKPDTFEMRDLAFQQRVVDGYRKIAKHYNAPIIDASQDRSIITDQIWEIIKP